MTGPKIRTRRNLLALVLKGIPVLGFLILFVKIGWLRPWSYVLSFPKNLLESLMSFECGSISDFQDGRTMLALKIGFVTRACLFRNWCKMVFIP